MNMPTPEPPPQPPSAPPWAGTEPVAHAAQPPRRRPWPAVGLGVAGAVVVAGLGAPLGWLWSVLAPDVPVEMTAGGPVLREPQPEQYFAADGWFTVLGLVFGLVVAVLGWYLLRRVRGPVALVAIVVGCVGAALLAWYVGRHVGLDGYQRLATSAPVGTRFGKPPDLRAEELRLAFGFLPVIRGTLLVPAFAAAATYTMMAGWSRYSTLRAETEPPAVPPVPAGVSSDSAGWPGPTAAPVPPGSGAAEPTRD